LIFLLHGSPGTNNTLTAELVAKHTKRSLLKVSTGELGSYEERMSVELKKLLTYASTWKAIVLIDEADVFLEQRKSGPDQFGQNNLVAIFLQQLEYFQGMLFLTSNRVSVFDAAVRSRIRLALQQHAPDERRRQTMWEQNLQAIQDIAMSLVVAEAARELAVPAMNGREIGNAVNTAGTLAAGDEGKLTMEHLRTVVNM